jgi:hypothetical protein
MNFECNSFEPEVQNFIIEPEVLTVKLKPEALSIKYKLVQSELEDSL